MNPAVVAALIAASVSALTLIGTLYGIRKTSSDTEKTRIQQREQLDFSLKEQREQLRPLDSETEKRRHARLSAGELRESRAELIIDWQAEAPLHKSGAK